MTPDTAQAVMPPSRNRLVFGTIWASIRRSVSTIFTVLGLPLFLLAALSAARYFDLLGMINVEGLAARVLAFYQSAMERVAQFGARQGISLPLWLIEATVFYLSFGNTVARAEKSELLAVEIDKGERWSLLKDAFRKARIDSFFLSLPRLLRNIALRLLWPIVTLYRLNTPFVVEGPGPGGDPISSSVPRKDLPGFIEMVTEANGWTDQSIYDFRQILVWHFALVALAGALMSYALSLAT